jgi:hypothetical protein
MDKQESVLALKPWLSSFIGENTECPSNDTRSNRKRPPYDLIPRIGECHHETHESNETKENRWHTKKPCKTNVSV